MSSCDVVGSRAEVLGLGVCLVLEYQKSSVAQPKHFAKIRNRHTLSLLLHRKAIPSHD